MGWDRAQEPNAKEAYIKILGPLGPKLRCHSTGVGWGDHSPGACDVGSRPTSTEGRTHEGRLLCSDSKSALSRTPRPFRLITGMRIVTRTGGGTEAPMLSHLPWVNTAPVLVVPATGAFLIIRSLKFLPSQPHFAILSAALLQYFLPSPSGIN